MYEYEKERNYFSMIEVESIIKTLNTIEVEECNLKRMKQNVDRLKKVIDNCVKNIDSRGSNYGQSC
jgi:hypothetical protein